MALVVSVWDHLLHAWRCTFSVGSLSTKNPHTSAEYEGTGWIIASNILTFFCLHICPNWVWALRSSNRDFFPLTANYFAASLAFMAVVKVKPRYRYLLTTSRILPPINHLSLLPKSLPFLNTITLLLSVLTVRPKSRHTLCKQSSWVCSPDGEHDKSARSSAKSRMNKPISPGSSWTPCLPFSDTSVANSFMMIEKRVGLRTHPCLSPCGHSVMSVNSLFILTQERTFWYIVLIAFTNVEDTPVLHSFLNRVSRFTDRTPSLGQ